MTVFKSISDFIATAQDTVNAYFAAEEGKPEDFNKLSADFLTLAADFHLPIPAWATAELITGALHAGFGFIKVRKPAA